MVMCNTGTLKVWNGLKFSTKSTGCVSFKSLVDKELFDLKYIYDYL